MSAGGTPPLSPQEVRRVLHRRIPVQPHHRFAHNLRQARLKKGISQQELGSRCELHRTEISLLERGGREPRLGTIVKLAGALDTSPGKLCAGIAWLPSTGRFQLSKPA